MSLKLGENEKFRSNLLVSDLGSYLNESLCSDLILRGVQEPRTSLRVRIKPYVSLHTELSKNCHVSK